VIRRGRAVILALALNLALVQTGFAASLAITSAYLTAVTKSYGSAVTCTLSASADSYVDKLLAISNFGTSSTINVSPNSVTTERAFVSFDLGGCSPAMPSDALIQSASLKLTVATQTTATRTVQLRTASELWTEAGLTWNSQPAVSSTVTSSLSVPAATPAGTVLTWTAPSDVQAFVGGAATNLGWRLSDSAEGVLLAPALSLGSREASSGRPQLVIVYLP
jgi:hyaluronate lyase